MGTVGTVGTEDRYEQRIGSNSRISRNRGSVGTVGTEDGEEQRIGINKRLVGTVRAAKTVETKDQYTVKSHLKAMGLYDFIRGFVRANKRGGVGLNPGGCKRNKKNVSERRDKLI